MAHLATPNDEDSATQWSHVASTYQHVGPSCEKCGAPIASQVSFVCRKCGWYASIGSYVEIDQQWEEDDASPLGASESFKMPSWAWVMIGCVVAVIAESLAARILTVEGSAARTMWSVAQLSIGGTLLAVCHFTAFVLLMREVSDAGLLDIILKPIKPWILRVNELPSLQWVCHLAVSSAVAIVMAVVVIGGIPYDKLLDWGTKKPVKKNLMGAIMSQAQNIQGEEKSLEEAVQDFAGKQDVSNQENKKPAKPKPEPQGRQEEDCLIIGYRANSEGLVYVLLLAGEHLGKLQFVGEVTPHLSVKELRALSDQMVAHTSHEPFVKMPSDGAIWVDPKFACRVSYDRKGKKGGLFGLKLESLLSEIEGVAPSQPETKKE